MRFDLPPPLASVLSRVSRSFGLSLAVLPQALRQPLALAYLLARAADTIADTPLLPRAERGACLDRFRALLDTADRAAAEAIAVAVPPGPGPAAERELLRRLPDAVGLLATQAPGDRARIGAVLGALLHGMQVDLRRFPGAPLVALETRAELDEYTYYAAGCVGEFWTEMAMAHCPALAGWNGPRMTGLARGFGQGLQTTNVLRDLAHDLRMGRCYVPRQELQRLGLCPEDLLVPGHLGRARPLLAALLQDTLARHADGWSYLLAIPAQERRLRLACVWPLLIGLRTLERIQTAANLLDPAVRVKIPRRAVYAILLRSGLVVGRDAALGRYYGRLRRRVLEATPAGGKETA
jgi:farnesyl-diphosphate farnesyltransferase